VPTTKSATIAASRISASPTARRLVRSMIRRVY
jgi:hypothetical protein